MTAAGSDNRYGPYGQVKPMAAYLGVSDRTLRALLSCGEIPHSRLPTGTILIAYRDVDGWLKAHRVNRGDELEAKVGEVLGKLSK